MRCVLYMLFILCLNPIAWKVRATEGYRLSKPISTKITHLLYIEDIKLFAASEDKVKRVMYKSFYSSIKLLLLLLLLLLLSLLLLQRLPLTSAFEGLFFSVCLNLSFRGRQSTVSMVFYAL